MALHGNTTNAAARGLFKDDGGTGRFFKDRDDADRCAAKAREICEQRDRTDNVTVEPFEYGYAVRLR